MKSISAEVVFNHMTPDALVDFMSNLEFDSELTSELYDMAYSELVRLVGTKDADEMLTERES